MGAEMIDFPNNPVEGQQFTPPGSYPFVYLGGAWKMQGTVPGYNPAFITRNRVVNSNFTVCQHTAAGTSVNVNGDYFADQWYLQYSTTGTPLGWPLQEAGVSNTWYTQLHSGSTADTSVGAADYALIGQRIEGYRVLDLDWGFAGAKAVILRFTARCQPTANLVGAVSLRNAAANRSWVRNIALTNTWQNYTLQIPGCTTGIWDVTTGAGIILSFAGMAGATYIGAGQSTWLSTNSLAATGIDNLMAVTQRTIDVRNIGLYLDVNGNGIPPVYEAPDFASELLICKRYWESSYDYGVAPNTVTANGQVRLVPPTAAAHITVPFQVGKSRVPTMQQWNPVTGASGSWRNFSASTDLTFTMAVGQNSCQFFNGAATGGQLYYGHWVANARP